MQAYLVVAPQLAQFAGYHRPLVTSLLDVKSAHWDISIRRLAAEALGKMAYLDCDYYAHKAMPVLLGRAVSPVLEVRLSPSLETDTRLALSTRVATKIRCSWTSRHELQIDPNMPKPRYPMLPSYCHLLHKVCVVQADCSVPRKRNGVLAMSSSKGHVLNSARMFCRGRIEVWQACQAGTTATLVTWQVRHGALLAVAELLPALAASNEEDVRLQAPEVAGVAAVVSAVEARHYLRGKGSYIMREALCRCVCCLLPALVISKPIAT